MRVRMETVRTVFFDMPAEQATGILEVMNQVLDNKTPADYGEGDLIQPAFEFRDKLARVLKGMTT